VKRHGCSLVVTSCRGDVLCLFCGDARREAAITGWRLGRLPYSRSSKEEVTVGTSRPVHEAIPYWENPQARMNYASARRRGLPVGSGNVKATGKNLVTGRLKRPRARGKEETGEHLRNLRALALSETGGSPRGHLPYALCERRFGLLRKSVLSMKTTPCLCLLTIPPVLKLHILLSLPYSVTL
jgi:hypothetical protein